MDWIFGPRVSWAERQGQPEGQGQRQQGVEGEEQGPQGSEARSVTRGPSHRSCGGRERSCSEVSWENGSAASCSESAHEPRRTPSRWPRSWGQGPLENQLSEEEPTSWVSLAAWTAKCTKGHHRVPPKSPCVVSTPRYLKMFFARDLLPRSASSSLWSWTTLCDLLSLRCTSKKQCLLSSALYVGTHLG